MQQTGKSSILSGLFWAFGERISAQLVTMLVTIVLARILDPTHYGVISIVTVIITFLNAFVSGGFDSALVQKQNADDLDFDSAFVLSFSLSCVLYLLLFLAAPAVAGFYDMPVLRPVIRVMGLRLILASFNSIQQAYVRRSMKFRSFFWATLVGTVISGFAGVWLALIGWGVWALVAQYLSNVTIDTIMLFCIGGWHPRMRFSWERMKEIWRFGWKVLLTTIAYTLEGDIRSLIVGKAFGAAELAYYDQGKKYPATLVTNVSASINKVMLPAFSRLQDEPDELLRMFRRSISVGTFILTPLLLGMCGVAESFVYVVLTAKWAPCIPFIQILSISLLTRPLEDACHQALLSIGRSDVVLKCMATISTLAVIFVIIATFVLHSLIAIAWMQFLSTVVSLIVFLYSAKKYLGYTLRMQLADIGPSLAIGIVMGVIVLLLGKLPMQTSLVLIIQIAAGMLVYPAMAALLRLEPYSFMKSMLMKKLHRG